VSVWRVPLGCTASTERRLQTLLDPGEAARAARFATPDLRRCYVVSHGVLRLILSTCTGQAPGAIMIAAGARGKPFIAGGPHFSLSHSDDVALVAVAARGTVGVDVEGIRPELRLAEFARDLLPAREVADIEAMPRERRERAWFQAWTRWEAIAKAADDRGPAPLETRDLDVDDAHVGALAAGPWATRIVYQTL
jgi:4'-phosphopantetheinyl transferase